MPDPSFEKKTLIVALIVTAISLTICFSLAGISFAFAAENADRAEADMDVEILRTKASDGVSLKALFLTPKGASESGTNSTPLIICCHGMNANFWFLEDGYLTLVKNGYAVLAPEFRGHKSNPAPSTYGNKEPYDILTWLNYAEDNFDFINITQSGILGHSMGGMFATSAYIKESLNRGRLKALVDLSGAVNISRAINYFTSNPNVLGTLEFNSNMTLKNPINYVNETFPENVYISHGTGDTIVDYNCSVDFINLLDPTRSRSDVVFYTLETRSHELFYGETYRNATAWFHTYVINTPTDPDTITAYYLDFTDMHARNFQTVLLVACFFLMVLIGCTTYLVTPRVFSLWIPPNLEEDRPSGIDGRIDRNKKKNLFLISAGYVLLRGLAFIFTMIVPMYFLSELMVTAVLSAIYVTILYIYSTREEKRDVYRWINPKVALIWIIGIVVCLQLYSILPRLHAIEDRTLVTGARLTWFVPFFTTAIVLQVLCNMLFLRFMFHGRKDYRRMAWTEAFLNGLIVFLSQTLMLSRSIPEVMIIPYFGISVPIVPLIAFGYFISFMIYNSMARFFSRFTNTLVPGAILGGLLPTLFLGMSGIMFIY